MQIKIKQWSSELTGIKAFVATAAGTLAIALFAQIAFYLPGNPVPITLQVFGVICCAMILGPKLAALAVIQYIVLGVCGLPVFSGFTTGLKGILGPTGGYLVGFIVAAYITGYLAKSRANSGDKDLILAGLAGLAAIYVFGAAGLLVWLHAAGMHFGGWSAWALGAAPFVLLDTVKVCFAVIISRNK